VTMKPHMIAMRMSGTKPALRAIASRFAVA
jgi:hypothetical protein